VILPQPLAADYVPEKFANRLPEPTVTFNHLPLAALSAAQLNATASVPGSFSYSPALGTTPAAGTVALSVTQQTYNLTVTGTSGSLSRSTTFTLTVQ
jgi:hypothetical protein